jgi:GT2 family glycosyltransferase
VATRVSVLVPSYGDADVLERSLPRIVARSTAGLEVVVLNNDASQLTRVRDLVSDLHDPRVRVLELEDAAGYCKAINAGIAATDGDLVFFANSDLFVADGYLDTIARFLEAHPRAACATGKILRYDLAEDRETDVIDTTGLVIGRNRRVVDRGENERDTGQFEREEQVFGVSGAALVARREALESVKVRGEYLDETFHMYKEDVDLSWRFRLMGWECWYVPSAVAYHARTSHGLAGRPYLRAMRAFHENEKRKSRRIRVNSMKNQWLILVKNDDPSNVARDLPYILGREALVLGHGALFSPRDTAIGLWQFVRALPAGIAKRREVTARRRVPPRHLRRWFAA